MTTANASIKTTVVPNSGVKCRVTSMPLTQQVRKRPLIPRYVRPALETLRKRSPAITSAAALKRLLAEVFPGEQISIAPHTGALLRFHAALPDQRPATCGAYTLTYLLPARGFISFGGESLAAEDYMAHLTAATIESSEDPADYRFPVRSSADPGEVGQSPEGVARAVAVGTDGRLATVPVPGRDSDGRPQLDATRWAALVDLIGSRFPAGALDVIFNYESDQLLAARDEGYNALNLGRLDASRVIARDRWGVGHFASLAATWTRPSGKRWLVLLNSFKDRGFSGIEPQPAELMRQAVVRTDGRGGGVLLLVPRTDAPALIRALEGMRMEVRMWSNGSPPPGDWRWQPDD
jgi:hypothetical protein